MNVMKCIYLVRGPSQNLKPKTHILGDPERMKADNLKHRNIIWVTKA